MTWVRFQLDALVGFADNLVEDLYLLLLALFPPELLNLEFMFLLQSHLGFKKNARLPRLQ